jgi:hypothetical protein
MTADNGKTLGFCPNKASFIFGYVGNLTDSAPQVGAEWDAETIQTLRRRCERTFRRVSFLAAQTRENLYRGGT